MSSPKRIDILNIELEEEVRSVRTTVYLSKSTRNRLKEIRSQTKFNTSDVLQLAAQHIKLPTDD